MGEQYNKIILVLQAELSLACCAATVSVMSQAFAKKRCAVLFQAQVRRAPYGFMDRRDDWELSDLKH